jgi:non-heme chloroperoxidase
MYRTSFLTAPDGVDLAVYEWGDPRGREVVFIHGLAQCALAWRRQMEGPALAGFRCVAWDLRGHGASDMPEDRAYYAVLGHVRCAVAARTTLRATAGRRSCGR